MDVTDILESFRHFLRTSWVGLPEWIKDIDNNGDDDLNDWIQANWESLVETKINKLQCRQFDTDKLVTLEVFGYGADNGTSSRIFRPGDLPTHFIEINGSYRFDSFGTKITEDIFEIEFPFDHLRATDDNGIEILLPTSNVTFMLREIK